MKATQAGGETATAAKKVAHLLHPHFVQEEAFAMPPLGALAALARGETPSDAASILAMTQRLRMEFPRMLAEHQAIVGALRELATAAGPRETRALRPSPTDWSCTHATRKTCSIRPRSSSATS